MIPTDDGPTSSMYALAKTAAAAITAGFMDAPRSSYHALPDDAARGCFITVLVGLTGRTQEDLEIALTPEPRFRSAVDINTPAAHVDDGDPGFSDDGVPTEHVYSDGARKHAASFGEVTVENEHVTRARAFLAAVGTPKPGGPWTPRMGAVPYGTLRLMPRTPRTFLIDGILVEKTVNGIVGQAKTGKSWLGIAKCIAVACGAPFLGRFNVNVVGKVLVFCAEEDTDHVNARIGAMIAGAYLTDEQRALLDTNLLVIPRVVVDLTSDVDMIDLLAQVFEHQPVLVLLDPLIDIVSIEDENSSTEMAAVLERMRIVRAAGMAWEHGCTVNLVHHAGHQQKGVTRRPEMMGRGSTSVGAKADGGLALTPDENASTATRIVAEARPYTRNGRKADKFTFHLDMRDDADGFVEWAQWTVKGDKPDAVAQLTAEMEDREAVQADEVEKRRVTARLLGVLKKAHTKTPPTDAAPTAGSFTAESLRKQLQKRAPYVAELLAEMAELGLLVVVPTANPKQPRYAFRPPPADQRPPERERGEARGATNPADLPPQRAFPLGVPSQLPGESQNDGADT